MADQVRRVIDIEIGKEVTDPKLGIDFQAAVNSFSTKGHLQALPTFNDNAFYFYATIKSHAPHDLKNALEEFVNTSLSVAKEMSPEVEGMLGEMAIEFGVHEDLVVVAANVKDNALLAQYAEMADQITKATVAGEAKAKFGILVNTSFNDLLTLEESAMTGVKANVHFILESSKTDKYAIKQALMNNLPPLKPHKPDDVFARLMILMFSGATFNLTAEQAEQSHNQLVSAQLTQGRQTVNQFIQMGRGMYQEQKEMVDSFPFVQAFFDSVEQYGSGVVAVGVYNKGIDFEATLHGADLSLIYRQIVQ